MTKVFVYGTLLNGEHNNNHFLQNDESEYVEPDVVAGFSLHDMGFFPACVQDGSASLVYGEVWNVSDEVLKSLDYLEGYPRFYDRVQVKTVKGYTAWIYINNAEKNKPVIASGSWRKHIGR